MKQNFRKMKHPFADESGAVTVEIVLWLPFFVILMTLIADVAFIFHGQARALEVAQNANRAYAIGRLASNSETETFVTNSLGPISPNAQADTWVSDRLITTVVTIPSNDLMAVGFFSSLASFDMHIMSQRVMEDEYE